MKGCSVMLFIFTINLKGGLHPLHLHVVRTCPPSSTDGDRTLYFGAYRISLPRCSRMDERERREFGRREGERVRQGKVKGKGGGGALQCR